MNKRTLSEKELCAAVITPAMVGAGWEANTQIREQVRLTNGQLHVRGRRVTRGRANVADYILYYRANIPIAVVEAKENNHSVGDGMQQGLRYAGILDIPFVFSTNGDAFLFHDSTGQSELVEREIPLHEFPTPETLWRMYCNWKGLTPPQEAIVLQKYYDDDPDKQPRYYQRVAINRTVEAIAQGRQRILLVMATGTGKTYTAFQIIWRLWKSRQKKRVLFLADRNFLVDQTMVNDFRPFGQVMTKLSTNAKTIEREDGTEITIPTALDRKRRRIDTSAEIYMALYQAITGPEEYKKVFKELSPDFFDLIVIDECHRGSVAADSAWHEILEYFSSATQIGLTATPKETEYHSNINYFGEPVYIYSLKQGIQDGFLAPYKVIKVHIDLDIEGYRPAEGTVDRYGYEVEDRIYNQKDFDRTLVLDERTKLTARKISEFLKESGDRFQKTIVFCVDTEHADRMRQALINENGDLYLDNQRYVMRMTGNDPDGTAQIDNFIDPESRYPVIVTTSRLLSTGVDAQTCRLIVLDREVQSMTEFKQILGRGTRVHEGTGKFFFTLIDFRKATNHFADPDFDGQPVQIYEPRGGDPMTPPDPYPNADDYDTAAAVGETEEPYAEEEVQADPHTTGGEERLEDDFSPKPRRKLYVDGVPARIVGERVEYLGPDGKLVTESLRDFSRASLRKQFSALDVFLQRWNTTDRKQAIVEELESVGIPLELLEDIAGKDLDPFDLICHIAFDRPPLTRRQRAEKARRQDLFSRYGEQARRVLEGLLRKYEDDGIAGLNDPLILKIPPFDSMGTPVQLLHYFGGRPAFEQAVRAMQAALYE